MEKKKQLLILFWIFYIVKCSNKTNIFAKIFKLNRNEEVYGEFQIIFNSFKTNYFLAF